MQMLDADSCRGYGHWRLRPGLRGDRNRSGYYWSDAAERVKHCGGGEEGRGPLAN